MTSVSRTELVHVRWCRLRSGRRERGTAAVETVALVPLILLVGTMMLQLGVAAWTTVAVDTAARQVARAATLGESDLDAVASRSLPGILTVKRLDPVPGSDDLRVTLSVDVPRVSILPSFTVTRDAVMPRIAP